MIGSDHPIFHMVLKEVPGAEPNDQMGRLTNVGCVCFGHILVENFRRDSRSHFTRTYRNQLLVDQQPDDTIRRFWELDAIGIREDQNAVMTAEEKVPP